MWLRSPRAWQYWLAGTLAPAVPGEVFPDPPILAPEAAATPAVLATPPPTPLASPDLDPRAPPARRPDARRAGHRPVRQRPKHGGARHR